MKSFSQYCCNVLSRTPQLLISPFNYAWLLVRSKYVQKTNGYFFLLSLEIETARTLSKASKIIGVVCEVRPWIRTSPSSPFSSPSCYCFTTLPITSNPPDGRQAKDNNKHVTVRQTFASSTTERNLAGAQNDAYKQSPALVPFTAAPFRGIFSCNCPRPACSNLYLRRKNLWSHLSDLLLLINSR